MGTNDVGSLERVSVAVRFPRGGDVLDSSPVTLGDYYRTHGESEHVVRLEAALMGEWERTATVADRAGVSVGFARKGLEYLLEEGLVEKRLAGKRWTWRRP